MNDVCTAITVEERSQTTLEASSSPRISSFREVKRNGKENTKGIPDKKPKPINLSVCPTSPTTLTQYNHHLDVTKFLFEQNRNQEVEKQLRIQKNVG
jgi:hypothetical protein